MAIYLLTWNPKSWDWEGLAKEAKQVQRSKRKVYSHWSCGNTRKIRKGDRFFLLKQGDREPTGIFGSGTFEGSPFEDKHWEKARAKQGDKALYTKISFDTLLDPGRERILSRRLLKLDPLLGSVHWDTQRSGIEIPSSVADELEQLWIDFVTGSDFVLPEEVRGDFFEGARREIKVNVYERDLEARQLCLEHYGNRCAACGFDFDNYYGEEIARGYIHVHHVVPLSEIGKEYRVDPINDLRPICPNCHAMVHRRVPAYTIDQIRQVIAKQAKEKRRRLS